MADTRKNGFIVLDGFLPILVLLAQKPPLPVDIGPLSATKVSDFHLRSCVKLCLVLYKQGIMVASELATLPLPQPARPGP